METILVGLGLVALAAILFAGLAGVRRHELDRQDLDTEAQAELVRRASRRAWRAE